MNAAEARPDLDVRLLTAGSLGDRLSAAGRTELAIPLTPLGVDVREHARVASVDERSLTFADGGEMPATPALSNGAAFRMTCRAGMPSGAHAADTVAAVACGREPERFDLGYIHMPISLGRRDGLIQWVDRANRPKPKVLVGGRAALYKELVTRGAVPSISMERRIPGALKWLHGGEPIGDPEPAAA
jgi:NADH dehydrogenase